MTVSTSKRVKRHIGNGVTTEFPYDFYIPNEESLEVYLYDSDTGVNQLLNPSVYSVTGIGDDNFGEVTYPLSGSPITSTQTLTIRRVVEYDQNTSIRNQTGFFPEVIEDALDHLTFQTQQNAETLSRATVAPLEEETDMTLPGKTNRASKVAGWDSAGEWIALSQLDKSADTVTALGSNTPRTLAEHLARLPDIVATGATTARSLADRLGDVLTPEDFAPVGETLGENAPADTAAIRAALAALPEGGTLRLKDGRTYYCQANASRLSPHWNTIPRVPVSDNSSFTVGEVITGGTSGTIMTVVGIDPGGSWIGGRDMVGSGFVNGEAITGDMSGSSTATGDVDFGGGGLYDTHVAFELTKPVTIEGRGTLKLIGTDSTSKLPYVFGNSKDVPISGLRFRDFTIDLDATANINAGSGQPRGFFLVKCSDVEIADSVTITSSAGSNCYGGHFMDCHKVKAHPKITSVSGGTHWIYCSQLDIAPTMDGFNEAIDLDKPCYDVRLGGTYRNGQQVNGQIFDINACSGVVLDGVIARNSGIVAFYNGKKDIAANFDDHIAGINYAFRTGNDFTISDNCEFYECNYSIGSASLVIGNNWTTNPHPGVRPVGRIRIGGSWTKCGFMRVYEADGITFKARLEDILTPTGANPGGAVTADSEDDWSTYPDAQHWSDLKIAFAPGFEVIGCNRRAVDIMSASEVTINGIKVRNPATFGNTADRAVYVQNIDKRSTKGMIGGNDIDCNNACDGIGFLGDGTGAPSITVLPNRIANWLNYPYRLSGTWQHGLKGQKWSQRLGKFAAADMPIADMPILSADANRGLIILQGWWADENGIMADPTDYVTVSLRRYDNTGSAEGTILSLASDTSNFAAMVPRQLGVPSATYQIVDPGKSVSLRFLAGGSGVDVQGTLILQYLEWTE